LPVLVAQILFSTAGSAWAQPVINTQPTNLTVLAGANATFNVAVTGTGLITYQWFFDGTGLPGSFITTVAGNGTNAYSGDGGAATNASFGSPSGVALNAASNLFISDYSGNRIRKVGPNGIITTVAGNGAASYAGDGVAATNTSLNGPKGLTVDAAGNLFIADYWNQRVRKVGTNGIITTVAGNGSTGYGGDGVAATNTSLYFPLGVAVDAAGDLFIADSANDRIREVGTNGIIATVAGGGIGGDGGPATNASLYAPGDVVVDATGNLFIADDGDLLVRKVDTNGIITTVAGNGYSGYSGDGGAATNASLSSPIGLALDSKGGLFIADHNNNCIREVATNGTITTVAGNGTPAYSGDGGLATNASLFYPSAVALDSSENLFIADTGNNRIRKVGLAGLPLLTLNNVTTNNTGYYQVIVSGSGGSVTSSVVTLTVLLSPPSFSSVIHNANGSITLNGLGMPGITNRVWAATNLVPPIVWQVIATNVPAANGQFQVTDTHTAGIPLKFYRISTP
jgi:sugar lactone lactonase YvrE